MKVCTVIKCFIAITYNRLSGKLIYLNAFVANSLKLDLRAFHLESFCKKKSATWKVFVFSAPEMGEMRQVKQMCST